MTFSWTSAARRLRRATLLLPVLVAWADAASPPIPEPIDFFPAEEMLWPVARTLIATGLFIGLSALAGAIAGAVWLTFASPGRDDRRPRPARIDRGGRIVEGPVLSGGDWLRTIELPGGQRRVEVLARGGWMPLDGDPLRRVMALGTKPAPRGERPGPGPSPRKP